jgi:hypothetical protein
MDPPARFETASTLSDSSEDPDSDASDILVCDTQPPSRIPLTRLLTIDAGCRVLREPGERGRGRGPEDA